MATEYAKDLNEAQRWIAYEWEHFHCDFPKPIDVKTLISGPNPAWFTVAEGESDYRRGFSHGFHEAVELMERLNRGGYVRVSEIRNILFDFVYRILLPWRYRAYKDTKCGPYKLLNTTPKLKFKKWPDVRRETFMRDGNQCYSCGSGDDLEAHHITPVSEGGLPDLENLRTLCAHCHREAG